MTTQNSVNNGLTGATGTGSFAGSTSPTFVTPILGAATATSITFSPTTGGSIGTTTNDNASAGIVGEFKSTVKASGAAISLTTVTVADVVTLSLTAGDWDVWGNVFGAFSSAADEVYFDCWASLTSATLPDTSLYNTITLPGAGAIGINIPYLRLSLSTTTTVYLSCKASFAAGTGTACGGIYARRAR